MTDLVQRLRNPNYAVSSTFARTYMMEAADELEAADKAEAMLRDEISALRSSLKEIREENDRLKGERDEARAVALEEAAKLIEEGYPRPGITNAHGRCPHGLFGWEDCEQCAMAAVRALKERKD